MVQCRYSKQVAFLNLTTPYVHTFTLIVGGAHIVHPLFIIIKKTMASPPSVKKRSSPAEGNSIAR